MLFPRVQFMVCLMAFTGSLAAQEAIFRNVDAQRNATQMRGMVEQMPYTTRWKDLRLQVGASLGVEWNDNVRLQETSPEDDFIFTPRVDFHAFHPIGEANIFTVDLGVGYRAYISADDLDQLIVSPGSTISYSMYVKEIQINFHNRMSYQVDPALVGAVSNTGEYGGLDNSLGFLVNVPLNRGSVSVGYDWVKFISVTSEFDYLDRDSHPTFARAGMLVHPAVTTGVEVSVTPTLYEDSPFNDNVNYSAGLYAHWQVSDVLYLEPRGGYTVTAFEANEFSDPSDYGSFYFGLRMDHRPNETVNYHLDIDKGVQSGVNATLSDTLRSRLSATWSVIRDFPLSTSLFYELGKEQRGVNAEEYDRYGGDVGISYRLMEQMNARLVYALIYKNSDLPNRDYLQNRVTLNVSYRF